MSSSSSFAEDILITVITVMSFHSFPTGGAVLLLVPENEWRDSLIDTDQDSSPCHMLTETKLKKISSVKQITRLKLRL